jgi:hypothetical protein
MKNINKVLFSINSNRNYCFCDTEYKETPSIAGIAVANQILATLKEQQFKVEL